MFQPRLSRALRTRTKLDIERVLDQPKTTSSALPHKGKDENHWKELKIFVNQRESVKQSALIISQLNELREIMLQIIGLEEQAGVIDDGSFYIINYFLKQLELGHAFLIRHSTELKQLFGAGMDTSTTSKLFKLVQAISAQMSDVTIEFIKSKHRDPTLMETSDVEPDWCWDNSCTIPELEEIGDFELKDLTPGLSEEAQATVNDFSMRYDHNGTEVTLNGGVPAKKYTKQWLLDTIKPDVVEALVQTLKTERTSEELQNELFELMGFDRFELIQEILQNRNLIVQHVQTHERKSLLLERAQHLKEAQKPVLGQQVIIQSEEQKQLLKQLRKDEQKMKKLIAKTATNDPDDFADEISTAKLKKNYKQQMMQLAINTCKPNPLLDNSAPIKVPRAAQVPRYPNVFDSHLEAKSHAGFLSGNKLMLPENVERTDNKLYEEVRIPASDPPPLTVGNDRIQVADLDEIGQIAFKGTKELNRIQTIVYPVAYHGNDNMLVCAPTGAGKTNVAMLAIVHTIRNFVDQGVIHRDQFKIVYVAPMKALAAEMTENFGRKLKPLGVLVRELTGDMQLTKSEMNETQMLVTTPEKWDVVTRKGAGDATMISLVKLLIIDEVHLLHGERGPVVEALVARTLRLVESSQSMIRIVGLSATLPNYIDVARFLRVNPMVGLFYFDSRFRPIPLAQVFVGVKSVKPMQQMNDMDQICYDKCLQMVQKGHQVMVFVHARNATARTATILREFASQKNQLEHFLPEETSEYGQAKRAIGKSRNKQVVELFNSGLGMHHAGMLRTDRNLVEKYFGEGFIKVLVCTATLAWGVNLPAHAVIIKGTEIYDSKHGTFVDLGILDVLQIFGRAGRPQFDKSGVGTIITGHDKLNHYLSLLTNQFPIESNFIQCLSDNLNAEVTLGTISNVDEAIEWLSYTYLFVRMRINPQHYGMNYTDVQADFTLERKRRDLIRQAAMGLDKARMIRFNERTQDLNITDLGRTASHFYIKYDTVEVFNELMRPIMTESEILAMISHAQEFQQLKVRDDEMDELDNLTHQYCELTVQGGSENIHGKVNILLQTYLSRGFVKSFSLISDMSYITQNAVRIARALFTIAIRQNNAILSGRLLNISKMFERQMWDFETPLAQFRLLSQDVVQSVDERGLSIAALRDMDAKEVGNMLRNHKYGALVKKFAEEFPMVDVEAILQPITRTVLRIRIFITPSFRWNDKIHGKFATAFWIWIEDPESNFIYHSELFNLTRKQVYYKDVQELVMTIPLKDPLPSQYYIKVTSDSWLGSYAMHPLSFQHLILPEVHPPHTELLPLQPLPVTVLDEPRFESLYNFTHFNPIQTQIFHCLYHTDNNVLLGAPTGSGKTIAAEIAIFRVFKQYPKAKVVYIAPLKALVRERIEDWKVRFERHLKKKVVELTGDVTPDARAIRECQVIVTTPEKWDGISRSWQTRDYVQDVALIVIDEIHLLGEDRGPVLEVIVSRTNFIASHTERTLRIVGLSTALANARDLANWLGITDMGLYNFKPSVRPVPLSVHISGYPGKHYCPRMATMNRPTFQAIRQYSPCTPALVFVSSRRQTRLTALDLISFLAAEDNPKQFLHMTEGEMEQILMNIKDSNLKLTLAFGIGLHHAGLQERDRRTCEELFLNRKIQILVATATLAWGVNLPAHLVVIKGTEYFDGKQKRYVDMPITDVLQMMGRAGRPQFGNEGVAVVLVHDEKKNFYKKFLYDPFPVESSLLAVLADHVNAEIVAGTVQTKQGILDYLTWTYFFRRLLRNPTYYKLESVEPEHVNAFLSELVQTLLVTLERAGCIEMNEEDRYIYPTSFGRISSYYYLSHQTMRHFADNLRAEYKFEELLRVLADAYEFDQHPVRHNEDKHNVELSDLCRVKVDSLTCDSPHVKTFLLLQAHFSRLPLPNADYLTDTKSVLDQTIRIIQAMIDICAERGWLSATLRLQQLMQCIVQARWYDDPEVLCLPHVDELNARVFDDVKTGYSFVTLAVLREKCFQNYELLAAPLRKELDEGQIEEIYNTIMDLPQMNVSVSVRGKYVSTAGSEEKALKLPMGRTDWLEVLPGEEYVINVTMSRSSRKRNPSIYCPKFAKGKDESWFLSLGWQEADELLALKRLPYRNSNKSVNSLLFDAPQKAGNYIYTMYLFSDGLLGFDQQYDIHLTVTEQIRKAVPLTTDNCLDEDDYRDMVAKLKKM